MHNGRMLSWDAASKTPSYESWVDEEAGWCWPSQVSLASGLGNLTSVGPTDQILHLILPIKAKLLICTGEPFARGQIILASSTLSMVPGV